MTRNNAEPLQPVPEPGFDGKQEDTQEYSVGTEEPTTPDRKPEGLILIFPERKVTGFDGEDHNQTRIDVGNTATDIRVGQDGETRLRAVNSHEESVKEDFVPTFEQLVNAFDQTLDAVLKTSGLDSETLERVRENVSDDAFDLITKATNIERPNEALATLLRDSIETHPETRQSRKETLLSLETARREAIQKAEEAERANNEQMYKEAMTAVYASERALFDYRATLQPDATASEKEAMADRSEGFVEIVPEPIYNKGIDTVQARLKELEDQMRAADSVNNQLAWETARNEFNRHLAVMPLLERVQKIKDAEEETKRAVEEATQKQILAKRNTLGKIWKETGYLQKSEKEITEAIAAIESTLRELDKGPATKESEAKYTAQEADRKIFTKRLQEVKTRLETFEQERQQLKNSEINVDLDSIQIEAAKTNLYFELGNIYKENPGMVSEYLGQALAGKDISAGTRDILTTFQNDLTVGRFSEVIPESEIIADEEHDIEPEPTVITSKTKLERAAKLDKMDKGLETVKPIPTIPESDIVPKSDEKEYGFGAPEVTRRVTPLRTEVAPEPTDHGDMVVGETFFPPKVETVEETRNARPATKGRSRMKAQEIEVPADVLEPTVEPPKDSDKALEEALARFNEAFPPRPSVEETSQIPRQGPETVELPVTSEVEHAEENLPTVSAPAEEQFMKPTGLQLFESALHSFGSVDAAQDTLIGLGLPKNIFNKIKTSDDLWNLYEKPSFWMKISGQADKVRNAIDLFIQQASTTEGGLSKTAGAEMRNKRDQLDKNKGGRAKGGLVN